MKSMLKTIFFIFTILTFEVVMFDINVFPPFLLSIPVYFNE